MARAIRLLVIVTSDHGEIGEHAAAHQLQLYREVPPGPLILWAPPARNRGANASVSRSRNGAILATRTWDCWRRSCVIPAVPPLQPLWNGLGPPFRRSCRTEPPPRAFPEDRRFRLGFPFVCDRFRRFKLAHI